MAFKLAILLAIGCVAPMCFGLPSNPSLKGVAQVAETVATVPLEGVIRMLECLGPMQVAKSLRDIITGLPNKYINSPLFSGIIHGIYDPQNYKIGDGLQGNGSILCGDLWQGELTLLKFQEGPNGTCVLGGDQTFLRNSLVNGNQYFLCDGILSQNYIQFFDGLFKLHWNPNANNNVLNFDFGPLGLSQIILRHDEKSQQIALKFPWDLSIEFNFGLFPPSFALI